MHQKADQTDRFLETLHDVSAFPISAWPTPMLLHTLCKLQGIFMMRDGYFNVLYSFLA